MAKHEFQQYSAQNLAQFREVYLQAINEEQEAGRIGNLRARALRRLAENQRRLNRLANEVCEECCASGHDLGGPDGHSAPDWSGLLEFIKQLLPLIAQLIAMFQV